MSTQKSPAPTSTKASTARPHLLLRRRLQSPQRQRRPAPAPPLPLLPATPAKRWSQQGSAKAAPATAEDTRGNRRRLVGVVTSDKMNKTVVVQVTRRVREAKFGKYTVHQAKYKAHSEDNSVRM